MFGLKAGLGFGGAIGGYLLASHGYVPNVAQTVDALNGIRLTASVYSAIPFAIGVVCLFFYAIDKRLNIQVSDELAVRRASGGLNRGTGPSAVSPAPKSPEAVVVAETP